MTFGTDGRFFLKSLFDSGLRVFLAVAWSFGPRAALRDQQQQTLLKGDEKMNNRIEQAKTEELPIDLNDLITEINDLPEEFRERLSRPLNRVVEYTKRRRRILNLIQEALSQLRMDMKYLIFDLDATRRERDLYKKTLDGNL